MAYSEELADRVRSVLVGRTDVAEVKMFGGLVFMVNTHMTCGIVKDDLMLRLGKDNHQGALERGARPMEMTGRPMPGMVIVSAADLINDASLRAWIQEAVAIATAQPPKPAKR